MCKNVDVLVEMVRKLSAYFTTPIVIVKETTFS